MTFFKGQSLTHIPSGSPFVVESVDDDCIPQKWISVVDVETQEPSLVTADEFHEFEQR